MKSTLLLLAAFFGAFTVFAQSSDTAIVNQQKSIYQRAVQYGDFSSAAYALTAMLHHGAPLHYEDSLAIIYYRNGNLNGSYRLANEIFSRNNKDVTALALLADISGRTSETKTSLDWYEKLVALDPAPFNYYQLATKQFMLDRRSECRQSLQKAISDSAAASSQSTVLDLGNGRSETVPVMAASYNMLGALAYKDKDLPKAKEHYQKALASFPEFIIAAENLKSLEEEMKPKPAGTKPAPARTKQ